MYVPDEVATVCKSSLVYVVGKIFFADLKQYPTLFDPEFPLFCSPTL